MAKLAGVISEKSADNLSIPAGEWFFRNFDTSANPNDVFVSLGHCSAASQTWEVNTISKRDASRGTREVIAQAEISRDLSLSITMDQWDPVLVSLACWGETAVKHIQKGSYSRSAIVSPGDSIVLYTDDDETPAYNYSNLVITQATATGAQIKQPVLDTMGGVIKSQGQPVSSGAYTGTDIADFYVRIYKGNNVAGTVNTGIFVWKKGASGTWSAPIALDDTTPITMSDGVDIVFPAAASGQDYQTGDVFKVRAIPPGSTLVEGIDYSADEVDVQSGIVRFATDSTLGFDTIINFTYDVDEQFIPRVYASTQRAVEGELRFEQDPTLGRRLNALYYKVRFSPTGEMTLIGEDFASQQLNIAVLADPKRASKNNPNSKYYQWDYVGNTEGILKQEEV